MQFRDGFIIFTVGEINFKNEQIETIFEICFNTYTAERDNRYDNEDNDDDRDGYGDGQLSGTQSIIIILFFWILVNIIWKQPQSSGFMDTV